MPPAGPRWTVSLLTIPEREMYLANFLASLAKVAPAGDVVVDVIYNRDTREALADVEARIVATAEGLDVRVHFNPGTPTIGGGRHQQLNHCRTPLVMFADDDLTLEGDVFGVIERALQAHPLAIVGLPSYVEDTDRLFKPRPTTPSVDLHGLRFMPIQGMLVAGYRRLFLDVGGFNPRREFWGEWTELNLRLWRHGFPTAYVLEGARLRHWEQAPGSPTRSMGSRELHVLWGLTCTALEYDAVDEGPETEAFWELVESRYVAYSFGADVRIRDVLRAAMRLAPRLTAAYPAIAEFRDHVRRHPFDLKPFHPLTEDVVQRVLAHAAARIAPHRATAWAPHT